MDWRIRPLTDEMIVAAAHSAWHFLRLAAIAIEQAPPEEILRECARFAEPPPARFVMDEAAFREAAAEIGGQGEPEILLELVKWRDSIAVIEDENPVFVASDECLRRIAEVRPRN
jgi:ribonuclease D